MPDLISQRHYLRNLWSIPVAEKFLRNCNKFSEVPRPACRTPCSKGFLPPPPLGAFAGEIKAAGIDTQVDKQLGQHNGAAVALQYRHFPTDVVQAFLKK